MSPPVTVVAVYWEGDFRGRMYNPDWVWILRSMVDRIMPGVEFRTLSNSAKVPGHIPLTSGWPGWWSKIELFNPNLPISGRILYLDLDTLPICGLEDIVNFPKPIAFCPSSFTFPRGGHPTGGRGLVDRYNSSVIVFDKGEGTDIYSKFTPSVMDKLRGDQDWTGHIFPNAATFPPSWFMKLKHCTEGPPDGVKVVLSMPWKCDVASEMFNWVGKLWTL